MAKFEQNEIKKKRPIENTWYDWLLSYIPERIRKTVSGFKYKNFFIKSFFKINTAKDYSKKRIWERKKSQANEKQKNNRKKTYLK